MAAMRSVAAFVDVFLCALDAIAFISVVADALETVVGVDAFCIVVTVVCSLNRW